MPAHSPARPRRWSPGHPAYGAIASATEALGHAVVTVPIASDGSLDLEQMLAASHGAGLLYLCNPNNPTGTLIPGGPLRDAIDRLAVSSPETTVVVGEAYHEYVEAPAYQSAVPLALASERVVVNRTFSKLYALAGLRLGYLIGQEATLRRLAVGRVPIGANGPAIAAGVAVLADQAERERQRRLNTSGRTQAEQFLRAHGRRFYPAHANYLFIEINREVVPFRAACAANGLQIGRYYAPASTWARLTIGTPEEMRAALPIFEGVLAQP